MDPGGSHSSESGVRAGGMTMADLEVAFGEQDSSLWLFQWMIENHVIDVVQPDLNYNGGFTRAARVARRLRRPPFADRATSPLRVQRR